MIRMSYAKWVKTYSPIKNIFKSRTNIDGFLYNTYGEEWEYVNMYHKSQIWTLVIMDLSRSASWEITNGIHFINRAGFLITKRPVLIDTSIHIRY